MSKYNHFAKELDEAFRAARSEYLALYNDVKEKEKNFAAAASESDEIKRRRAELELQEALKKMRPGNMRVWDKFDAKAAELRRDLALRCQPVLLGQRLG